MAKKVRRLRMGAALASNGSMGPIPFLPARGASRGRDA
jgi:hypothetical protein